MSNNERRGGRPTRYQKFSQPRGITRIMVGQVYWHVMIIMLSRVTNIERVRLLKNGIRISTFV